ncbi:MSMEG_0570 family nitrogen starvation response protein [Aquabacterium sp.]|jgi:uncharacterized repeat protein (TIGR04042 family)|uniref:MSMEG_0570 family nitrogen starvation response protein n=1 Tax=Aquabacterium sp. TaxID=1872578 RepID=UPI0027BA3F24|nr:MSMEG_0570 family nitrogen starvation response protein [Aquabacterium sp.]
MPEMHFTVRWPDGGESRCYSPSLVIQDHLTSGQRYPLADFLKRTHDALSIASERVRAKYGFACSRAMDQWAEIESNAQPFLSQPGAEVEVLSLDA